MTVFRMSLITLKVCKPHTTKDQEFYSVFGAPSVMISDNYLETKTARIRPSSFQYGYNDEEVLDISMPSY